MNASDPAAVPADACFVGIDVAQHTLDVAVLPAGHTFRLAYGDDGLAELVGRLRALAPAGVVVEATGGYERRLAGDLLAAGLPVAVVNPARVRQFAKGTGTLAKNDRLDSLNLAAFAQVVRPRPREQTPAKQQELDALVTRRASWWRCW